MGLKDAFWSEQQAVATPDCVAQLHTRQTFSKACPRALSIEAPLFSLVLALIGVEIIVQRREKVRVARTAAPTA